MADFLTFGLNSGAPADNALEDERLTCGLQEGREEAYEELVAQYEQPVYNLVYRLLSDPRDVSDVVQEVFLKIFRNIEKFRHQSSLKTWIYRIAVNEAHNYRRWVFRHQRNEVTLEEYGEGRAGVADMLSDEGRSPLEQVLDGERLVLIEEALSRIPPVYRAAVVLRDMEDLSYDEVAQVLDVSIGTVKSRILRGREALRRELLGRLEPEPALQWSPQPAE